MYGLLKDLRAIEGASFIAGPSCGLYLAQMGAEVIRFDAIGGGPDFRRWPRSPAGASFYWEGLNKGKKSIALDLRRPEGRELAVRLATAGGKGAGLLVTNYPAEGFLAHERLARLRPDMITVRIMGWGDGAPAMDHTVNSAVGFPLITGPSELGDRPVNHVLPAWDLLAGSQAAFALMVAERNRRDTGKGQEVRIPLGDVGMASVGHLGQIAEVAVTGVDRARYGNDLFGAFGRDFTTRDGVQVMAMAVTPRQWQGLVAALEMGDEIRALEIELGVSFAEDEGMRFRFRERLFPLVGERIARRPLNELAACFERHSVCWGPYRTLKQALETDPRFSAANPLFTEIEHASGHRYLTPGPAAAFAGEKRETPVRAPRLGEHTDEICAVVLGLPEHEIGRLHDQGIVAGADSST
jgi:2-methylfumaryl-CoA isomerase